jgi:hypothetical protein
MWPADSLCSKNARAHNKKMKMQYCSADGSINSYLQIDSIENADF